MRGTFLGVRTIFFWSVFGVYQFAKTNSRPEALDTESLREGAPAKGRFLLDLSRFGSPIRLDITAYAEKVRSDKWLLLAACLLIDFIGTSAESLDEPSYALPFAFPLPHWGNIWVVPKIRVHFGTLKY